MNSFSAFAQDAFGGFTSGAQEFMEQAFNPQNDDANRNRGPPPASGKALRQLPTVTVTAEDLVDENNRECCICLEP